MTVGHHADLEGKGSVIAIVRALLKHVLTLDETTSALAACTEWLLIEAIGRLMRRRTAFFIAHRLYAILSANNIVALLQISFQRVTLSVFSIAIVQLSSKYGKRYINTNSILRMLYEVYWIIYFVSHDIWLR